MPTAESKAVSQSEAKSLFAGLEKCPALVLAVSGGPDSIALMWLAARWRKTLKAPPKLIAVTIDHGLRKEAKREAAGVAKLARKLGLAHRTLRWTGAKPATGLQQAARNARYRLLAEAARKERAAHILTAHTLDDQAETVLIRMARGSGLRGLTAMQRVSRLSSPSPERGGSIAPTAPREARPDDRLRAIGAGSPSNAATPTRRASLADLPLAGGGQEKKEPALQLVRPLLDIAKTRLIATCKAAKIPYAEDPSNRDPRFTRARLRGLMPELAKEGLTARRLAVLAQRLRRADRALEVAADRAEAKFASRPSEGGIALDAAGFLRLPAEIALRLLGRAVAETGDEGPVELSKLESLNAGLKSAQNAHPARFRRTLAGALVTLNGRKISVERAPARHQTFLTTGGRGKAKVSKAR